MDNLIFIETSGFSMWPFVRKGEKLIIRKASIQSLKVGDIILYRANSQAPETKHQLVCHRLVKKIKRKDEYLLYTRGDNSTSSPEIVTEEMFLGKAVGIMKNGRVVGLTDLRGRFMNRIIVIFAPLATKILKPAYIKLRNFWRG